MNNTNLRELARNIFMHTLAECSVEQAYARKLFFVEEDGGTYLRFDGENIARLDRLRHMRIVAAGKAAGTMLEGLLTRLKLPPSCDIAGVLIVPEVINFLPPGFQFFSGSHPYPGESSFAGARAALSLVRSISSFEDSQEALCIFLISGGASAMMELPLDPAISLEDTIAFHRALVLGGGSITEINCVRKHFSAVKGGRLAMAAGKTPCISLLVSDVPPPYLDAVASGPTLPDSSSKEECLEILARYRLMEQFPASVRRFFSSTAFEETPGAEDLATRAWTLLSATDLAGSALQQAEALGFHTVIDNSCDDWDYRAAAEYLLNRLRALRRQFSRVCIISVGEVSVSLQRSSPIRSNEQPHPRVGTGGRNQHFALHAATLLDDSDKCSAILSAGSDGIDGNSEAAGAVVNEETLWPLVPGTHAVDMSLPVGSRISLQASANMALASFDSFAFMESIDATIRTGPTGNNLRDIRILLHSRN